MGVNWQQASTVVLLLLVAMTGYTQNDPIYLKSTVTGTKEQPTVSYIIPWQAPVNTEAFQIRLGPSFIESTFEHLDRQTLQLQHTLRQQLTPPVDDLGVAELSAP